DRFGLAHAEAVLKERAARGVVLEKLRKAAFTRPHRLVDRLLLFLGCLSDKHFAGLLGTTERLVLRLRMARKGVHEVGRRRVDIPLDDSAALHVHEDGARVAPEDVLVVAVDVVIALLARSGAPLRQDALRL